MASSLEYSVIELDTGNETALEQYEKTLYQVFIPVFDTTSDRIFIVDRKNKRLRSRITYANQNIFLVKSNDWILGGVALNFNQNSLLQLELLGFQIERSTNFCEGLRFFMQCDYTISGLVFRSLRKRISEEFKKYNTRIFFGTCTQKNVRGYTAMGFSIKDHFVFNNEKIFLLSMDAEDLIIKT